jgi:hypothetical protein
VLFVQHPVRLDEDEVLRFSLGDPKNEVWIKPTVFKKADALAP